MLKHFERREHAAEDLLHKTEGKARHEYEHGGVTPETRTSLLDAIMNLGTRKDQTARAKRNVERDLPPCWSFLAIWHNRGRILARPTFSNPEAEEKIFEKLRHRSHTG